ncbi:MAG: protein kinase [Pseudomonadales bacterium]
MSQAQDVTVLRPDASVSSSYSSRNPGHADAPRVLKQRFVLEEKLGSGGMGTVFRAKDLRKVEARDRQPFVAIKVLNNDFREHPEAFIALQREAVKSQALSHPNIVSIFDFDKDGDLPFIIMELLEGQELATLLRAYPTGLPDELAWQIISGLCAGLEHAHAAGLVHADFKPGNVFVSSRGRAKILDFGIARAVQLNQLHDAGDLDLASYPAGSGNAGEASQHADGAPDDATGAEHTLFDPSRLAALTPAYASREMLEGRGAEPRDDIYSLGVVIYLILTGTHPFGRTPAHEAAQQRLRADRPRRLNRRQWRVLERCLAFDREDRPADIAELRRYLLEPSPWRSRSALLAALAVAITIGVAAVREDAAINEVTQEVRQSTLVDAAQSRLAALLDAPTFEPAWQDKLDEEARALLTLQGGSVRETPAFARIRALYTEQIGRAPTLEQAQALYQRALTFGPMEQAQAMLRERFAGAVQTLLDAPELTPDWLDAVEQALGRYDAAFADASAVEALRLEVADVLEQQLVASIEAAQFPAARRALAYLQTHSFDPEGLDALRQRVDQAEQRFAAQEQQRLLAVSRQSFEHELAAALGGPCAQLDPTGAGKVFARWLRDYPGFRGAALKLASQRVGTCMSELAALDRDRALTLHQKAEQAFGPLPALLPLAGDPCGMAYLVGNGAAPGRAGFCTDRLSADQEGPRLVVVPTPAGDGRYGITRSEVSWSDLQPFCVDTGRCDAAGREALPASGISLALVEAYAAWLSARTGYVYRLPTLSEWRQAAAGEADRDRNCRTALDAAPRGPVAADSGQANAFGLVGLLGNLQEWVVDGSEVRAMGGNYSDPIDQCVATTARAHDGTGDPLTGFRLVREVS